MNTLSSLSTNGHFLMLALDHRESLKKLLNPEHPEEVTDAAMREIKEEVLAGLLDETSGLLVDPEIGLAALHLYQGEKKPYLLSIEKSGYTEQAGERIATLEHTVEELKTRGASGVKLLLYFNPTVASAAKQVETAKTVLSSCQKEGLPLFIEFLTYDIPGHEMEKGQAIVTSLRYFLDHGVVPAVFKVEFPGSAEACRNITDLLGETPWILLTKGVDFMTFKNALRIAAENGAKGFLAGRSLWQDFPREEEKRTEFFATIARSRFEEIVAIMEETR